MQSHYNATAVGEFVGEFRDWKGTHEAESSLTSQYPTRLGP